jgi:hypothetical protein
MHPQDVATGSIEPGKKYDLVPWPDAIERVEDAGLENEPGRRGALVTLIWGQIEIGQGRFDSSKWSQLELWLVHARHSLPSRNTRIGPRRLAVGACEHDEVAVRIT